MSEEDVRGGLRDAVAGEPPLDFDPDALMASARQQVKRRRALFAAGVATVAVAVAAVAVPVALGRDQGPPATTQAAAQPTTTTPVPPTTLTTSTTTSGFDWPPPNVKPVRYTNDELRTRGLVMREHLLTTVPNLVGTGSAYDFGQFGGEAEDQFYDGQDSINTHISFTLDGARYSFVVEIRAPGAAAPMDCQGDQYCHQLEVQDGGPVMTSTTDLGAGVITTVRHYRPSGTVVSIAAYNYDMAGSQPVYQPTIPVTLDQLMTLATDPNLGL